MNIYDELLKIVEENPDLVFNNDGYENLPRGIVEENQDIIDHINNLMRANDPDFVSFQNFKPRKDGSMAVRYQGIWSRSDPYFIGVVYDPLESFKPKTEETEQ